MREDRMEMGYNFPNALRLVQSGCQVRRAGWDPSLLYISRNAELDRVELVREDCDDEGPYCYAEPWLGGAAIGRPLVEVLLAEDWRIVKDPRKPTESGGERATAADLDGVVSEGEEAGYASGAVGGATGR
jgi:hypothetical protein